MVRPLIGRRCLLDDQAFFAEEDRKGDRDEEPQELETGQRLVEMPHGVLF